MHQLNVHLSSPAAAAEGKALWQLRKELKEQLGKEGSAAKILTHKRKRRFFFATSFALYLCTELEIYQR